MTRIPQLILAFSLIAISSELAAQIIINEIHADPAAAPAGDANRDGVRSSDDDEFVELVNSSVAAVDISGWTLSDEINVRHTFPGGTVIPANCALVIFGGGTPTGSFGGALVQTATSLGLNNTGDTVSLNDGTSDVSSYTYGSEAGSDQSITRDPDVSGSVLVRHATISASSGALFSPGTQLDGTPFSGCSAGAPGSITVSKATSPAGATGFDFTGDLGTFGLDHGQSRTFDNLVPGDYAITETQKSGWILDDVTVTGSGSTRSGSGATIHLGSGESAFVNFNNLMATPEADLAVLKTDDADPVFVGDNLSYTISVTNLGPNTASNVTISDLLPATATFVSVVAQQGNASESAGLVSADLGEILNGQTVTVTIVVQAGASGTLSNSAEVTSHTDDPVGANNTDSEETQVLPLPTTPVLINEVDSDTPGADEMEFIELFDGGAGGTNLDGLVVVLYNGSNDQSYAVFDLDGNSTSADGYFVLGNANVANVNLVISNNALQNGADAVALYFGDATDFANGTPLNTSKLVDALVYDTSDPDDEILKTLLNAGQPQADENGSGDKDAHSLQRLPNGTGGARNTDSYIAIPPTPGAENLLTLQSDLMLTKIDAGDPVFAGDEIVYTLTVVNNGPDTAENVIVRDPLPPEVTFVSALSEQGTSSHANGIVTAQLGNMVNGGRVEVTLTVLSNSIGQLTNNAEVISDTDDPDEQNNTASESTGVVPVPTTSVLINEVDSDTPGADDMEFIELFDGGQGNTSLDGLVVVLFNGTSDVSYASVDLAGSQTDADGFFVLGSAATPNLDLPIANATLQNGPDAVALYFGGAANFPNGTAISASKLVDAIVYATGDPDDPGLLALLNAGQPQADESAGGDPAGHSLQRIPNGAGGVRNTAAYEPAPPTPGGRNRLPQADLVLTLKDAPDPITLGEEVTFGVRISNKGADAAQHAVLVAELADGLEFVYSDSEACSHSGGVVSCDLGEINEDEIVAIEIVARGTSTGRQTTSARVSSATSDPVPGNNGDHEETTVEEPPVPDIAVPESNLVFEDVPVGQELDFDLFVKNRGNAVLSVDSTNVVGPDAEHWLLRKGEAPFTVGVKGDQKVIVCFRPTSPGDKTAVLRIRSNDPDEDPLEITLAGSVLAPHITASVDKIRFGQVDIGQQAEVRFDLRNAGNSDLVVDDIDVAGSNARQFKINDTQLPLTLPPSGSEQFTVFFRPDTLGLLRGLIRFRSNDPVAEKFYVSLNGKGTGSLLAAPVITATPDSLDFGVVRVQETVARALMLSNTGNALLEISTASITGPDSSQWRLDMPAVPISIQPNDMTEFTLLFEPLAPGPANAQLLVSSNDPVTPFLTVPLSGTATLDSLPALTGVVVINEIHYNPGTQQGPDREFEFLELVNVSDSIDVSLAGWTFTDGITHTFRGNDSLQAGTFLVLAIDSSAYPGSTEWTAGNLVNAGETITLVDDQGRVIDTVTYGNVSPWPAEANGAGPSLELRDPVSDNAASENWQASAATGGTPGVANSSTFPALELAITPVLYDFGILNPGDSSTTTLQVSNHTESYAEILAVHITGADSNQFLVEPAGLPIGLATGQVVGFVTWARPNATGIRSARLRVICDHEVTPVLEVPVSLYVNSAPSTPVLSPPDQIQTTNALTWGKAADPDSGHTISYAIQIARDVDFSRQLFAREAIGDTSLLIADLEPAYGFEPGQFYSWRIKASDPYGGASDYSGPGFFQYPELLTAVTVPGTALPERFLLHQNYPNPFNPETQIQFELPARAAVTLKIFDVQGQEIVSLLSGANKSAGVHQVIWNGKTDSGVIAATGTYFYRLIARSEGPVDRQFVATKKMVFLK